MLVEAGEENAGLRYWYGLACCFKIESHNHPSALEPYQGAATGVGELTDIFTMGARPIAQLNSLRFGNINLDRTKWLVKGVAKVLVITETLWNSYCWGEVSFNDCYNTNPLVNAFSAGIMRKSDMISQHHLELVTQFLLGSFTAKMGLWVSFASKDITEDSAEDLPAVQVEILFKKNCLKLL